MTARVAFAAILLGLVAASTSGAQEAPPLPDPVDVRPDPDAGVTPGDPAFEPLPGARADYGRLGGSVYEIEIPANWNGKLLLFMHGFEELAPTAQVSPPDIRTHLIAKGYAWGASSFSSTSLIPGRAADETAALWDFFARRYGRPARTYVMGESMGGMATHIAAERYGNRFDGALAGCGAEDLTPGVGADFFVAGAYAAGVTQAQFERANAGSLIHDRIIPQLRRSPRARRTFEEIMLSLTGGRRAFDRQGLRIEEDTNWRRAQQLVTFGLADTRQVVYRLGPPSRVSSREFNRRAVRLRPDDAARAEFLAGNETTGRLQMPLLSLHTTGDGQVPVSEARVLQRRVNAAGLGRLLRQRVLRDPGHCGFTNTELEESFEALVGWVEQGVAPRGHDVLTTRLDSLRPRFEINPRPGTAEAGRVPGAKRRVVLHGRLKLDREPFYATTLGAVVQRRDGLVTPCQLALSDVANGRYSITVLANAESSGCGGPGTRIALWEFANGQITYSRTTARWPRTRRLRFDTAFTGTRPNGSVGARSQFAGEVYRADGTQLRGGTRVEAFVGSTRCGLSSVRRTGSFSGFILDVVGPDAVPGCRRGAPLAFRVNGRPAQGSAVNGPGGSGSLDIVVP